MSFSFNAEDIRRKARLDKIVREIRLPSGCKKKEVVLYLKEYCLENLLLLSREQREYCLKGLAKKLIEQKKSIALDEKLKAILESDEDD